MTTDSDERKAKLQRFLHSALKDDSKIDSTRLATLFIEGLCVCYDDPATLADAVSTQTGLRALQRSVRQDVSPEFINGTTSLLLHELSDPAIAPIAGGQVLAQIVQHLLQPTFFWSACVSHLKSNQLDAKAVREVAWLLSEALRLVSADTRDLCMNAASDLELIRRIMASDLEDARSFGYLIKHRASQLTDQGLGHSDDSGPGGRHDNDFKSIMRIEIMPTRDEILSKQPPFLRKAAEVFDGKATLESSSSYFDHMFRLLREDMVSDFKDKLNPGKQVKRVRNNFQVFAAKISGIEAYDIDEEPWKHQPWSVCFTTGMPLPGLAKMTEASRKKYLMSSGNFGTKILQHGSLLTISVEGQAVGFGYVTRNVDRLAANRAEIIITLDDGCVGLVLDHASRGDRFKLVQSDVPAFAYKPFLKSIQQMQASPLCEIFLNADLNLDVELDHQSNKLVSLLQKLESGEKHNWGSEFQLGKVVELDSSQRAAMLSGLSHKVSLIQGPPGTGKSFIGALITRLLHDNLNGTIMVICMTNHALDQFTEDLMDTSIPSSGIVRLGTKSTDRTASLLLHRQRVKTSLTRYAWTDVREAEGNMKTCDRKMRQIFQRLCRSVSNREILEYLEFHDDTRYFHAFQVPRHLDGMSTVGKKGKAIGPDYLLRRWQSGDPDAGVYSDEDSVASSSVWQLPVDQRRQIYGEWRTQLRKEHLDSFVSAGLQYNLNQTRIRNLFKTGDADLLAEKRIIACTSTYAAMSTEILSRVRPETIILEEAGELLEPHVLAAMHNSTQRLIMIGDHKQLRPKIISYPLTVESGEGYDLNRSLFERLILKGIPHVTLIKQHRMRPEIAGLVRCLTYPLLEDAPSTKNRPDIRGLQQNVVFVDHREPEDALEKVIDRDSTVSRQNQYEATLALRYVKYLAQQGYGSEDIVVLTPYLGQLRLLRQTLSIENDPVLNDIDNNDLFAAGLLGNTPATSGKPQIHLSSIDNYQGEEKKIVIVSLTRSNLTGDIGFMSQAERVNVLLSRARDGLIVIGNMLTFTASQKGGALWSSLRKYMGEKKQILKGLPIQCQTHPDVKNIAVKPDDFLAMCPDGGCSQTCPEKLSCGVHKCPSRCHILVDHSKIVCVEVIRQTCSKGHVTSHPCHAKPVSDCMTCKFIDEKRQQKAKQQLEKTRKQEADQRLHDQKMDELDEEIASLRKDMADMSLDQDRSSAFAAKKIDLERAQTQLENAKKRAAASKAAPSTSKSDSPNEKGNGNQHKEHVKKQNSSSEDSASDNSSPAREEWLRQKHADGQSNDAIDEIMSMVGLEEVKQYVLDTKGQIEVKKRQNVLAAGERYHATFLGNPGTGKTTVARLWARLLYSLDVLTGDAFEETTGSKLATGGTAGAQKHIDAIVAANGGVMFVDEAYQLTSGTSAGGKQVLDFLLAEIENRRDKIVFIFAGYRQPMETFYSHNPGIPSRIPHRLEFRDYTEAELLHMLQKLFKKRFNDNADIDGGTHGLFMRITVRRLSKQRGAEGFGNMRDLENLFQRICARQASRINTERRNGTAPDDFHFNKEDLIGPEPSSAVLKSAAWSKIQSLIGLDSVKESIQNLVSILKQNYLRELEEKEPLQVSLNKVFLGPPGTGKTSVAKLYGRLLADIGLLTNGDVLEKTPTDFIGAALGASEQATSGILESAKGKVLIIDEAYMLNPTKDPGQGTGDPYRTAVIDTIVSKVHNVPGDDQCVLLLGYEEEMEAMFQHVNPGFSRRFPLASAFRFDDFTADELRQIFRLKLAEQDLTVTEQGEQTAMDTLSRARKLLHFGNAGEVSNVISKAKLNWQKRITAGADAAQDLDSVDFDPDFNRAGTASTRLQDLFKDSVGFDHLVKQLRQYQVIALNLKAKGLPVEDHVPFNFIFKGPPGTGKTTTARKIGQVYYDMGLLERVEVVECSVSDLVGEYVGQTGPKTKKQLEKGLGKVLFVDEAYRLAEGHFASEAVNELTDILTKPRFKGKLVVILAGYEDDMNNMIATNPGLASRFPESVQFSPLSPRECLEVFTKQLSRNGLSCETLDEVNDESTGKDELLQVFEQLTKLKHWGNGRDVGNLSNKAMRFAFGREVEDNEDISNIPHDFVLNVLKEELIARCKMGGSTYTTNNPKGSAVPEKIQQIGPRKAPAPPPAKLIQDTLESAILTESEQSDEELINDGRDDNVSDAVWRQLQADIATATNRQLQENVLLQALTSQAVEADSQLQNAVDELEKCKQAVNDGTHSSDDSDSESEEAATARRKRLQELERARLKRAAMMGQQALAKEKAAREKERQEQERKKEAETQKKLRQVGVCVAGFQWIKQSAGYRCAGGFHFVSHAELDSMP